MNTRRKKGFTLVELLVVCAIMVVIVAVAVPSVVHYVKSSETKADKTIYQSVVNNVSKVIMQYDVAQRAITTDTVLPEIYSPSQGAYNAAAPHASSRGTLPYLVLPKDYTGTKIKHDLIQEDKYFEVEFIGYTDADGNIVAGAYKVSLKEKDGTVVIDGDIISVSNFKPNKGDCTEMPLV